MYNIYMYAFKKNLKKKTIHSFYHSTSEPYFPLSKIAVMKMSPVFCCSR